MKNDFVMRKLLNPILIILISLPSMQIRGQGGEQLNVSIAGKFSDYCQRMPWEDIYIHTDRDEYISGETIWFNTFLTDRLNTKPSGISRIVYFEVLNGGNRPVVQKKIRIEEGTGRGMAVLPDTLSSGSYIIRAYTNWMKNFLPFNCFIKKINVFNAINLTPFHERRVASDLVREDGYEDPSGYYGGKGIEVTVVDNPDTIELLIKAEAVVRSGNRNRCLLFVHTHGIIDINEAVNLFSDLTKVNIPKNSLTPGINHITLFNSESLPFFERYTFTPKAEEPYLSITPSVSFEPRSKFSLEIGTDISVPGLMENTMLSISVTPGLFTGKSQDISDYLIFGSEFGILPDEIRNKKLNEIDPDSLSDFLGTIKSRWIDWDKILSGTYDDIRYLPENENHYLSGTLLDRETLTGVPDNYVFLSTPAKTAGFQYSKTDSDGNFNFHIPLDRNVRDLIIQSEDAEMQNSINMGSSFSDLYNPSGNSIHDSLYLVPPYISKMSSNYQISRIYGIPSAGSPLPVSDSPDEHKRFYGKPDIGVVLDDFIRLPVMEEVFFELLPGVTMKSKEGNYEISILDRIGKKNFSYPPFLLIDGVPVNDANVIADLDPDLVEKIDVVQESYIVGDYVFYGIVNVITKAGDYSDVPLPENAVRFNYRITDEVYSFVSPDYSLNEIRESRIPDFRNTLFWNPALKPGADGKVEIVFRTSDSVTDYFIDIQGLTSEGIPLSYRKILIKETD
ncbi:MAG: hypothetical protein JXN62_05800 [Bacteroidales bacterium]|nr:hypothetical protein [Bacteroidales bacterium]